jgi:hypothetical protein
MTAHEAMPFTLFRDFPVLGKAVFLSFLSLKFGHLKIVFQTVYYLAILEHILFAFRDCKSIS